ncbi:MAG TPA: hypothetical protein VGH33_04875 [Isosphaeraceae bacterium]|jgi:hypothetical protein
MRYRTEILIPPDRYVCVQLPAYLPEGRAIVIVTVNDREIGDQGHPEESDPDRQDIEWWNEFEADRDEGR